MNKMNEMNEERYSLDEYLKENGVICMITATQEELQMVMSGHNQEPKISPNLVDYDPASRYYN